MMNNQVCKKQFSFFNDIAWHEVSADYMFRGGQGLFQLVSCWLGYTCCLYDFSCFPDVISAPYLHYCVHSRPRPLCSRVLSWLAAHRHCSVLKFAQNHCSLHASDTRKESPSSLNFDYSKRPILSKNRFMSDGLVSDHIRDADYPESKYVIVHSLWV